VNLPAKGTQNNQPSGGHGFGRAGGHHQSPASAAEAHFFRNVVAIIVVLFVPAFLVAAFAIRTHAQFPPPPGTGPGLAETIEAIDSARVTTRILYITAHPDDESASVLTYLARGLHADVALLSLTRGEGGQNDLGPEQAPQLGLIRTQELLAATRGYGVKLYFTRARDFGFSKTPEETQKIWGDAVLEDMVRVIRTFCPNVVFNNFGGVHTGHGHHQTAGLWTPVALKKAADPSYHLPGEVVSEVSAAPWGEDHAIPIFDLQRFSEKPDGYIVPMDDVSPLWGKSYREIGTDAFANHRTQGITAFLASPFLRRPIGVVAEGGGTVDPKQFGRPLAQADEGCATVSSADTQLAAARLAVQNLDFRAATADLAAAAGAVSAAQKKCADAHDSQKSFEMAHLQRRIDRALELAAALKLDAEAATDEAIAGEPLKITAKGRCRPGIDCSLGELRLILPTGTKLVQREGDAEKGFTFTVQTDQAPPQETAWDLLQPNPPPLIVAEQTAKVGGHTVTITTSITHIEANSTRVDRVPLRLVPAYTLSVEPKQAIEVTAKPGQPFDVLLRVHSHATQAGKVSVGLDVPTGWSSGSPVPLEFSGAGDRYARVKVTPVLKLAAGTYKLTAFAQRGSEKFSDSLDALPTLPTQMWSEPAQCIVHAFDINVSQNLHVGYITAENEPVPEALQRLGIQVEMLNAAALAFGDLSRFNAIVVGVRAYELRPDLAGANQRLQDYASNGGTVVVQYERDFAWDRAQYAPYPAKISGGSILPRVTDETSPVKFLKPDDPLLNRPNKITQDDFKGWVQERGLYFWTQFDPKYTPLLAMNDPGEAEQNGSLVYAKYGKGIYIYTGLAFFRQLPEGVPGAYRLFVNLLSASGTSVR
jgi:LmbE family N-acetylglucosaminyl deacetylase